MHNYYVLENRSFIAIHYDTIENILIYLNYRLDISDQFMLKSLIKISGSTIDNELKDCYKIICFDYELNDFVASYREATSGGIKFIKESFLIYY